MLNKRNSLCPICPAFHTKKDVRILTSNKKCIHFSYGKPLKKLVGIVGYNST